MERPAKFIDGGIEYDIRLDIVHVRFGDHGTWALPISVCEREHAILGKALRDYRAKQAEVVRLPRRKGAHAARS